MNKLLELNNFIKDNCINYRWQINKATGEEDLTIWVPIFLFGDFVEVLKGMCDCEPIECYLIGNDCCFWMEEICTHFNCSLEDLFYKPEHAD